MVSKWTLDGKDEMRHTLFMKPITIDLRQLRAFSGVGTELNFMRAADRLCVSQPALSQTIRQLELRLGVRLFERNTHKVTLTEEGAQLLKTANDILAKIEILLQEAQDLATGRQGTLRVGYLIGAAVDLVPIILRKFSEQFPAVKLSLKEYDFSTPDAGLCDNSVDVAILRPPIEVEGLTYFTLFEEGCVACIPEGHPLANRTVVSVADLVNEPIIAAPGQGAWRDYWIATAYRGKQRAAIVHEAATFEGELQAVAAGIGISITAEAVSKFYNRPGVKFVTISDMASCEVSVALPALPTMLAQSFASIARSIATTKASC
ncbi:Transcriptional regulator, LysR family [Komagataeibacter xylinus E25]|nr:Transcriptional regulator, LysR family [Komagataeibacter xylinus E25]